MEYVDLEKYATRAMELASGDHGLKPHRLRAERSRLAYDMLRILRPSLNRLSQRKRMTANLRDEVEQVGSIGILRALEDWDASKATFSTYVHWKILAELKTLEWTEFPDRRRLTLPQPLRFVEMDRPTQGDDFEGETLRDRLVAEDQDDILEEPARRHIALHGFERVFSHHVMRRMQIVSAGQNDAKAIESELRKLMRNRWIYICRVLHMETYETIAGRHGITRERVRQIINELDDALKGQLPTFNRKADAVVEATRPGPADIHEGWDAILIAFYMDTGIDSRLIHLDAPLPTRPLDRGDAPRVVVEDVADAPIRVEPDAFAVALAEADVANNVVPLPSPRSRAVRASRMIGVAAMTGALALASAAGAQSRALPPEAPIARAQASTPADARTDAHVERRTSTSARTRTTVVTQNAVVTGAVDVTTLGRADGRWAVSLGRYDDLASLKANGRQARSDWTWLRGLRSAYMKGDGGYQAIYGPLTRPQAFGMCHEAKRRARDCGVVPFGAA